MLPPELFDLYADIRAVAPEAETLRYSPRILPLLEEWSDDQLERSNHKFRELLVFYSSHLSPQEQKATAVLLQECLRRLWHVHGSAMDEMKTRHQDFVKDFEGKMAPGGEYYKEFQAIEGRFAETAAEETSLIVNFAKLCLENYAGKRDLGHFLVLNGTLSGLQSVEYSNYHIGVGRSMWQDAVDRDEHNLKEVQDHFEQEVKASADMLEENYTRQMALLNEIAQHGVDTARLQQLDLVCEQWSLLWIELEKTAGFFAIKLELPDHEHFYSEQVRQRADEAWNLEREQRRLAWLSGR